MLSPCNIAMIPSYISAGVVSSEKHGETSSRRTAVTSLVDSGAATLGLMSIIAPLGLVLALSFRAIINLLPITSIAISLGLLFMGGLMILDIPNPLMRTLPLRLPHGGGPLQFYLLGAALGTLSLSCTLPVFLMVMSYAAVVGSLGEAAFALAMYAVGIALVLIILSVAANSSRSFTVGIRRNLAPYLNILAGSLVTIIAIYMLMYQLYHLV